MVVKSNRVSNIARGSSDARQEGRVTLPTEHTGLLIGDRVRVCTTIGSASDERRLVLRRDDRVDGPLGRGVDLGGLVADTGVEDAEVPGERKRDDIDVVVPGVTDLVVVNARTDCPGGDGLASLGVPELDGAIGGGGYD